MVQNKAHGIPFGKKFASTALQYGRLILQLGNRSPFCGRRMEKQRTTAARHMVL